MNIIKGLTAMTSLTVFMGMMTPTAIVSAATNSTNDSHEVKTTNPHMGHPFNTVSEEQASSQFSSQENNVTIFGNGLLQQGETNLSVARLQNLLHKLGYYNGTIDGSFGNSTLIAVDAFQADQKIAEQGIVGAATKTALFQVFRTTPEYKTYQEQLLSIKAAEVKQKKEEEKRAKQQQARQEAAAKAAAEAAAKAARDKQQQSQPAVQNQSYQPQNNSQPAQTNQSITVLATSYDLGGRTATGIDLDSNPNAQVIAVDPSVIPLGSRVLIPGYGVYVAADTGGAIRGNRIDIHFPTQSAALNFGVQTLTIQILN
ncbi:MAG: 3D domain-containing protein [Sporolactobacillus sp.]